MRMANVEETEMYNKIYSILQKQFIKSGTKSTIDKLAKNEDPIVNHGLDNIALVNDHEVYAFVSFLCT